MSTRLPAPQRRAQLLETATRVFAVDGFHATTMDDIASDAGVTKPVVYQHFESKRELFVEVLREAGRRLSDSVAAATAKATTAHQQVTLGMRAYFDFVAGDGPGYRLLFGDGPRSDPEFAATVHAVESSIATFIADLITTEGLDDDDRHVLAHGVIGLAEGTARHWHARGRNGEVCELAERVAELAWSGLRGSPQNP